MIRLDLDLGPDASFGSGIGPRAVLSPDGLRLVVVSEVADGIRRLLFAGWISLKRLIDGIRRRVRCRSFLPMRQWIGFFAEGS